MNLVNKICLIGSSVLAFALVGPFVSKAVYAHEGHAALPTRGLTVQGDELLLSEGARRAIDLQTEMVTLADIERLVKCNAHVELPWQQQAMVTTQVPGQIGRVLVRPGDSVEAGQELASVESLELESLQLAMLQADAELALARDQFQRQESLSDQGVIAGKAALETQTQVQQRTVELEVAMCKLGALGLPQELLDQVRQLGKPVTRFAITSPIAGMVADADIRTGQIVKTTEHLFHIVDLSTIWAIGEVLEGEVAEVRVGQPATVQFKSLPEKPFTGKVDHLHLSMNDKRRTRAVAVALDNREGLLRPGMFGQMEIEIGRAAEAIVCPIEGIIRYFDEEYVLLNRGEGKYLRRPVRLGVRNGSHVEILDGLFPGDQVVVTGNHVLFSLFANETPQPVSSAKVSEPVGEETSTLTGPIAEQDTSSPDHLIVVQGTVELPTDQKAFASARIEGRIARILVNHSQPVHAGDVLAEVESLQLRNLQGELLESQAKLNWTSERLRRLESFAAQNISSKKELWELQKDERVLANRVASVVRRLTMIGISEEAINCVVQADQSKQDCDVTLLRNVPIRAAIDGAVSEFNVVPGQIVGAQETLFEIHDASTVWVKGYVFQGDASRVQPGQEVNVTFHALPDKVVKGTVVRVSPVLNAEERVLPLWVEVDNSDGRLIEGMLARVEIQGDRPSVATADTQVLPR